MNDYISFLCTLLSIKIPKVYFKENGKVYDLKNKPVNKEFFQVKDTSICTSYPKENVICVNLDLCKDRSLVYIYLAHEIRHLYQYACVYKKNQKVFSIDERSVSIWKKELENYADSSRKHYENQEIEKDANLFANFYYSICFTINSFRMFSSSFKFGINKMTFFEFFFIFLNLFFFFFFF